jgi:hypothetical protein
MHQSCPCKIPIDEAWYRSNGIEPKPEHQILRTVSAIDSNHFIHSNTHVIHQPVPDACDAIEELSVCPCLPFEYEKRMVRLVAERLVFEDVVCQNAFTHSAAFHEAHDFFGLRDSASAMYEVVPDVVFSIEVGSYSGCASRSCDDWYWYGQRSPLLRAYDLSNVHAILKLRIVDAKA